MEFEMNRRQLLRVAQGFGAMTLLAGWPIAAAAAGTVTRRNVMDPAAKPDLDTYAAAVGVMRTLPASDKRSWTVQARIHNDHCPHGNWYFLPWHRAYLAAFENIIRDVAQKPDFALPYWNWTTQPTLPPAFWQGSLNDPTRTIGPNDQMSANYVGANVINNQVLNQTNYQAFGSYMPTGQNNLDAAKWQRAFRSYGALEGTPHNYVHGRIGGNMGNYMSPLDPIFWLHHGNVDRLWVVWRNMGRLDETNSLWLDFSFPNNFYLPNGTPISPVVKNQQSTEQLGYVYDDARSANVAIAQNAAVGQNAAAGISPLRGMVLESTGPIAAATGKAGTARFRPMARTAAATPPGNGLYLICQGVTPPDEPSVGLRVFIETADATAATSLDAPGYIGSVAFFGRHDHGGHGAGTVEFVLDASAKAGSLNLAPGKATSVTIVPVRLDKDEAAGAPVTMKSVELVAV